MSGAVNVTETSAAKPDWEMNGSVAELHLRMVAFPEDRQLVRYLVTCEQRSDTQKFASASLLKRAMGWSA